MFTNGIRENEEVRSNNTPRRGIGKGDRKIFGARGESHWRPLPKILKCKHGGYMKTQMLKMRLNK